MIIPVTGPVETSVHRQYYPGVLQGDREPIDDYGEPILLRFGEKDLPKSE